MLPDGVTSNPLPLAFHENSSHLRTHPCSKISAPYTKLSNTLDVNHSCFGDVGDSRSSIRLDTLSNTGRRASGEVCMYRAVISLSE